MRWKLDMSSIGRRLSHLPKWMLLLVILPITARLMLPFAVKAYVNHELNQAHDYTGKIGDVNHGVAKVGLDLPQFLMRLLKELIQQS